MLQLIHDFLYDRRFAVLVLRAALAVAGAEMIAGHIRGGPGVGAAILAFGSAIPSSGFLNGKKDPEEKKD